MDGLYLLGFGPRTARAARDLAARLYPKSHRRRRSAIRAELDRRSVRPMTAAPALQRTAETARRTAPAFPRRVMLVLVAALIVAAVVVRHRSARQIYPSCRIAAALCSPDGDATPGGARRIDPRFRSGCRGSSWQSIVGALLAASGTVMQGLFRNPLADPGLVGVSAGAGLAAAAIIVSTTRRCRTG